MAEGTLYGLALHAMSDVVGTIVATAVLDHQLGQMSRDEVSLEPGDMPELGNRAEIGLTRFVGPEVAREIGRKIEGLGGGGRE